MTHPTPGVPNWVDLATADLGDAARFYTALFGWTADVSGDEFGGYTTFLLNGLPVAGAGPLFGEGQQTAWSTYFAAADADTVAARVEASTGKVLVAPFDVVDQGRMGAFLDPAGAPFSVWEAGMMRGAEVFDLPGALTWNELNTRDLEGAKAFYGAVFGWTFQDTHVGGLPYVICERNHIQVAGMQLMIGSAWPDDMPPHWLVYFAVGDCDAAAEHASALGGHVLHPPTTIAVGRYAVIEDPQGGTFAILAK
ncbi:VOC family protein [Actinoplanes rectilineatus]|uniref:VOC family protein n=1 Tax=Actinoplanes rectilineatus TaxID=113571 RepID=UPI0005F282CD|nr:VOC family protein [Actinoplanes rectilineatus]